MRTLTPKERMLATVLATVVFLAANLIGVRWIAQQIRASKMTVARLKAENAQVRLLLEEKPYWMARKQWLVEHPLEVFNEQRSGPEFTETVRSSVERHGLTLTRNTLLPLERSGQLVTTLIELDMKGSLEAMTRWIYSVQKPGDDQFLRKFTLKKAEDGNTMELNVVLGKVFTTSEMAVSP